MDALGFRESFWVDTGITLSGRVLKKWGAGPSNEGETLKVRSREEGCQSTSPPPPAFPQPLLPVYLSAMAMTWDAPLVSALAGELVGRLRGDRLRAHEFHWEEREIVLHFRSCVLRWALHPTKGWVVLDDPVELPDVARPLSAELVGIQAPPDERLLVMEFRRSRGKVRALNVVFELMTNQWNALLLEGEEGRIRHLLWTRKLEDRPLLVGRRYRPPEPSTRRGIQNPLSLPEWQALATAGGEGGAGNRLLEEVAFISSINIPGLLPTPTDTPPPRTGEPGGDDGAALLEGHDLWRRLRSPITLSPCLLETSRGKQPYPYVIKSYNYIPFVSLLSAIRGVIGDPEEGLDGADQLRNEVEQALHRARKRVEGLGREMADAADPEEPRGIANLLLARLRQVPHGASTARLEGFGGEVVEVSLSPELTARENAEALYAEAARRERAKARLPALLEKAEKGIRELEEMRDGLREGSLSPEEVRKRLPTTQGRSPGKMQGERLPYRTYRSSGGLEIRVGRGSKDNDALTFKHSRPMDIWLHARDSSGAHVILRWDREGSPPKKELEEAAILAALNSGNRGSATVPVDWTRRKYVRKARKAPPGTVIPQEVRTLFVEPDPGLPIRLREADPSPL